jgi:hypothetical protein
VEGKKLKSYVDVDEDGDKTVTFILGPPPISTSAAVGAGAPSAGGAGTETAGAGKGRRFLTCPFGFAFVPHCSVAATHITVSEPDRKASFSAAKRTVLDDALRRLNIRCLERSAPAVEPQLFEAYCWNTNGTAADGSPLYRIEDPETPALTSHLNRVLLRVLCNRFLADARQKQLFVNVIDGGHSHAGKLDLALFTDAVPLVPSFELTIAAIDIKTPLKMSKTSELSTTQTQWF